MKWWDQMPCYSFFECWVLGQIFHSSFIFIKRLFSSSLLTVIKVVSSAYLRLLILLQAVLIPACERPAWHFAWYTLYRSLISRVTINKLTHSFVSLETVHCSTFSTNCCFLSCIQISQEAGKVIWYSHLFQNFPLFVVILTVKVFGVVSKAEIDVFLELSCSFDDPADVGNLISGSSAFSKTSLNIWKFMVHVLLKPEAKLSLKLYSV